MAVRPLRLYPDAVLRRRARPVERVTRHLAALAREMAETMYQANGIGLAAPQVGETVRLIVVDVGEGLTTFVNPAVVEQAGNDVDVEGCLSIPAIVGYVERPAHVALEALDLKGRPFRLQAEGLYGRAIQHEIDHLNGVLFIDRASRIFREERREGEEGSLGPTDGARPTRGACSR